MAGTKRSEVVMFGRSEVELKLVFFRLLVRISSV